MLKSDRLLSAREVTGLTTLSKPTIYKLIKRSDFPKQVRIGDQKVAWLESEVRDWVGQRAARRAQK